MRKAISMGAVNFYEVGTGTDYTAVFRELCDECTREYGYDAYNGTISTTGPSSAKPVKIAEKFSDSAMKKALKYVEKDDWGVKWTSRVLDLGIIGWEIVTYEKTPRTSAAAATKFQTFYVGYAIGETINFGAPREVCVCKTAAEAKQLVKAFMDKHLDDGYDRFYVEKETRKVDGKGKVDRKLPTTTFEMVKKVRITKSKPKNAAHAKAIHKWMFYGYASC